jgi:hypothetical protein
MPIGSVEADAFAVTPSGAAPEAGLTVSAAAGAPTVTELEATPWLPALSVTVTFGW